MKTRNLIAILMISFLASERIYSTEKVGAAFLKINPSARLSALGNTGIAMAEGASSLFINPAGAGQSSSAEIMMTHSQGMVDTSFDALGFVLPFQSQKAWAVGLSAVRLSESNFDGRGNDREKTGSFTASDTLIGASVAKNLGGRTSLGVTVKGIQQRIADASASGAAVDVGIAHQAGRSFLLGLAVNNVGGKMKFMNESYNLPATAALGIGYRFHAIVLSMDAAYDIYGRKSNYGMGIELFPVSPLSIRMGYMSDLASSSLSSQFKTNTLAQLGGFGAGIGLKLGQFQLDYALIPHQSLDETHRITLSARFGRY